MSMEHGMEKLVEALRGASRAGCLTGAGVSTLCGIPDFRGPQGLYRQKDAERTSEEAPDVSAYRKSPPAHAPILT